MTASNMDDPQSSTSQQVQVPTLPTLPDPHALWSAPHSSKYLLQEARASIASFDGLRAHVQSGRINYGLEPPTSSALIELPGIPVPNRYTPTPTGREKPAEIPDLPTSWKDKGKGKAKSLDTFQEEWGKAGWIAEDAYGGKAIRICSPNRLTEGSVKREGLTIWATVSGDYGVDSVKVFVGKSSLTSDLMSPGWHIGLSNHLTSLHLTVADLLYRAPHLPQLLHSTCFHCGKYLKVPDGLPVQHTGYLAGKAGQAGSEGPNGKGEENKDGKEGGGKWVCWHDSCGEQ